MPSSHKGQPLKRRDRVTREEIENLPDPDYITGPDGRTLRLGFDAQYHPRTYFAEPHTAELVKAVCRETRPFVGRMPRFLLWAYTRVLLETQR